MSRLLLVALLLATAAFAAQGQAEVSAQVPGTLSGWIRNGTADAPAPGGLEVVLRYVGPDAQAHDLETVTADDGSFTFEGLPETDSAAFFLGVTYQGVSYTLEGATPVSPEEVQVQVYETVDTLEGLRLLDTNLVVTQVDSREGRLAVLEAVRLENSSDRTFVVRPQEAVSADLLFFPLPPGASSLDLEPRNLHFIQIDGGFILASPVPPGVHELLFSYTAPYEGEIWTLPRVFPIGATAFRLLLPDGVGDIEGEELVAQGQDSVGPLLYNRFEAPAQERGSNMAVTVTGLPGPSLWHRLQNWVSGEGFRVGVIPAVAGAGMAAALGYALLRRRRDGAGTSEADGPSSEEEWDTLMGDLARLEADHEEGKVDENAYRERRGALKGRMAALVQEQGPATALEGGAEGGRTT